MATAREALISDLAVASPGRSPARVAVAAILGLVLAVGLASLVLGGVAVWRLTRNGTASYDDVREHFKYGSIGSEPESGLPYWIWRALPALFEETFQGGGYEVFGFVYETEADGNERDLPIGVSRRVVNGVEVAWLNCGTCHTGTVRESAESQPRIVPAMPSNNLDLHRFIAFILAIADDDRLSADRLIPAMEKAGAQFDWIDRLAWRYYVIPRVREGLLMRRVRLQPLLDAQPAWGPGRVDTFNPYKLVQFGMPFRSLSPEERIGTADFPSIFEQGPRGDQQMNLHWDGDNASLQERNLSAALGAGVTERTVDHASIERIAEWLRTLPPDPSPHRPAVAAVQAGRAVYMEQCAGCHGYQADDGYRFEGARLGQVTSNRQLRTDAARLDSYTERLRGYQLELFKGDPKYQFRHFKKTDGYANAPLDGLWLRAPYLHNGSVPTLADLLAAPDDRPTTFVRGLDVLDHERGGFEAPACTPGEPLAQGFCFDTREPGNGRGGHEYGTTLDPDRKAALLAYLMTF
jgi:hypothetical protein